MSLILKKNVNSLQSYRTVKLFKRIKPLTRLAKIWVSLLTFYRKNINTILQKYHSLKLEGINLKLEGINNLKLEGINNLHNDLFNQQILGSWCQHLLRQCDAVGLMPFVYSSTQLYTLRRKQQLKLKSNKQLFCLSFTKGTSNKTYVTNSRQKYNAVISSFDFSSFIVRSKEQ